MGWFKIKLIKICTLVILLICYVTINIKSIKIYAFGGYTHRYIGSLAWQENMSEQYEKENKKAYVSGIMVADIGLLNWDKKFKIKSDSVEFKNKADIKFDSTSFDLHYEKPLPDYFKDIKVK